MSTTFPYERLTYSPAAAVLPIVVSVPADNASLGSQQVTALCDTGADITCFPARMVAALGLLEVDEIEVSGYEGEPELKSVYAARLQVSGGPTQIVRAVVRDSDETLLGRDVLNSFRLEFDGPGLQLTLL